MKTFLALAIASIALLSMNGTASAADCDNKSDVVVPIGSGGTYHVCGTVDDSASLFVYKGIKYALGARWQPPKPIAREQGSVVTAKFFGAACPQDPRGKFLTPAEEAALDQKQDMRSYQSEACLTLNIYSLQAKAQDGKARPVMVFIHGGAFLTGTGTVVDGTGLAHRGAVVVTLNYRRGALGFMTGTNTSLHPAYEGNYGFLDQQEAMRWVFENIEAFGGDKTNITLFGESAGAMSVGLHTLVAPGSTGLFANAIMESNPLGLGYPDIGATKFAGDIFIEANLCARYRKASGKTRCVGNWMDEISACDIVFVQTPNHSEDDKCGVQRQKTASQKLTPLVGSPAPVLLQRANERTVTKGNPSTLGKASSINLPWTPNVDKKIILGQPLSGYAPEIKGRKPIVLGVNADEGVAFSTIVDLALRDKGRTLGPETYSSLINAAFGKLSDTIVKQDVYDPKRVAPLPNPSLDKAVAAYGNVLTDHDFICGNVKLAERLTKNMPKDNTAPVFTYYFAQRPFFDIYLISAGGDAKRAADEGACAPVPSKEDPRDGKVCHANELVYVFDMMDVFGKDYKDFGYKPQPGDRTLASQMANAWVNFASDPKNLTRETWKPFATIDSPTLVWGGRTTGNINLYKAAKCEIWYQSAPYKD